ncbi:Cytoplasmic and mitochondrial histidine tRNA synthetase [Savitreella phatthalungensis]
MAQSADQPSVAAPAEGKSKGKTPRYTLKVPKGTKDWQGGEMILRERIFSTLQAVFKRHGAVTIDTPVFELREILAGKYGEDSKLIYDLADQGGELCSLRYDLTVPFARWLAMNPNIDKIRRYHIAKVYRRDQPAVAKGRMREFYQCDYDVAGQYDSMVPDAEVLRVVVEALEALDVGDFTVKLNHRKILDGVFEVCGVPEDKIRTISSAVDKLDKLPWTEVRKEMVDEKGLAGDVADRIGEYVVLSGDASLLDTLDKDERLTSNARAKEGLAEMRLLFDYLDALDVTSRIRFDLSLARGLDYYTGVIYEAVTEASAPKAKGSDNPDDAIGVGSIAAGGRYDNLVGMFTGKKTGVPCVGVSIGVERVFSILRSRLAEARASETQVFIMALGKSGLMRERMQLASELWKAGLRAEFLYKKKPNLRQQFEAAEKAGVPVAVILGEQELEAGTCKIKRLGTGESNEGDTVNRSDVVAKLKEALAEAGQ